MGYLSKKERDVGVCATVICPHCQALTRFTLRQVSAAFTLFGFRLFDLDRIYQLYCSACKFRKDISLEELLPAMRAKRLLAKLEAGELEPTAYVQALDALKFPALHALREEARSWTCAHCGERVPEKLNGCWKCNSPRPGLHGSTAPREFVSPPLPDAINRPSNPWE